MRPKVSTGNVRADGVPRPASSNLRIPTPVAAVEQELDVDDFRFKPSALRVQENTAVTLRVENEDGVPHTVTITELDVDQRLEPDQRGTITFTPRTAGSFTVFCRFHRDRGMTGTLEVTKAGRSHG